MLVVFCKGWGGGQVWGWGACEIDMDRFAPRVLACRDCFVFVALRFVLVLFSFDLL